MRVVAPAGAGARNVIAGSAPRTVRAMDAGSATIFTFAEAPEQPDLKRGHGDHGYKDDPDRDQHQQLLSCRWGAFGYAPAFSDLAFA